MKDNAFNENYFNQMYLENGNEPFIWLLEALRLRHSYSILSKVANEKFLQQKDTPPNSLREACEKPISTALMLAGYSVENFLKGLIIRSLGSAFEQNNKFREELKEHNLVALAQLANINLSQEETQLLAKITQFTVSFGRYPIPLRVKDSYPINYPNGGFGPISMHVFSNIDNTYTDVPKINAFMDRLESLYADVEID